MMTFLDDATAIGTKLDSVYPVNYASNYGLLKTAAANQPPVVYPNPVIAQISVTRNNYDPFMRDFIENSAVDAACVDGPTGCGKSTMCLLASLRMNRVLHCSPIPFIQYGVYREFAENLPKLVRNSNLEEVYPIVDPCLTDLEDDAIITGPLALTTYSCLVEFIKRNKFLPPFDVIVLDEYHASLDDVVLLRNLIYCKFADIGLHTRFALISATPPGRPPKLPSGASLCLVPTVLPSPSIRPVASAYLRRSYRPIGVNLMLIPCETPAVAAHLATAINAMGERAVTASQETTLAESLVIYESNLKDLTICADRLACTGVTFPFSVIVNSGQEQMLVYDKSVLRFENQLLSLPMAAQVHGRGGRISPTVVYYHCTPGSYQPAAASEVLCAKALIKYQALIGSKPPPSCVELHNTGNTFQKLNSLSPTALKVCLQHQNPLLRAYEVDASGEPYVEYGGKSTTFVADCADAIKFFKTPNGTFFGLLFDMTFDYDPTAAVSPAVTQALAEAAATRSKMPSLNLTSALKTIRGKWSQLGEHLWGAFTMFHDANAYGKEPSTHTIGNVGTIKPDYMFGDENTPAWELLHDHGAYISERPCPLNNAKAWRVLNYNGKEIIYNPKLKQHWLIPTSPGYVSIDGSAVGSDLLANLNTAVTAAALIDDPSMSIDLAFLKPVSGLNSNTWAHNNL
jgi:hypothetical protein